MQIRQQGNKKECTIDSKERDLIITANKELDLLDSSKREFIKSILDFKLNTSFNAAGPDPLFKSIIANSLTKTLSVKSATFLLNMLVNYKNIGIILDKLSKEMLITKKTHEFVFELSIKYGSTLDDIIRQKEDPHHWASYSIHPIIFSKENIQLQFLATRMDHQQIHFNMGLYDSLRLSISFLEESINTIELIDKELILSFNQNEIKKLEEIIAKIKGLSESIELDIKQTEELEASLMESAPKSEN